MARAEVVAAVLVLGGFGYLATTIHGLRSDVVELRERLSAVESVPATASANTPMPWRSVSHTAASADTPSVSTESGSVEAPVDPTELEALVHRTVAKQSKEREAEATAKWLERASIWTEKRVDALVGEGVIDEAVAARVVTVLVNEMHDGADLKRDVQGGRVAEDEGWAQWAILREENDAALVALVGEAATQTLRDEAGGK
jgi:hypothetical protein